MKTSSYVDYVLGDALSLLPEVRARAMFGGYGLYLNGVIFGIIADEVLYFKVDSSNQAEFKVFGSKPFSYKGAKGKKISMSYWEVPQEVLEDPQAVAQWAQASAKISSQKKKRVCR